MCVVVGVLVLGALESWAEFTAPVFARGKVDVGREDESKLGVLDGYAVGLHSPSL